MQTIKVAHFRLAFSRQMFLVAYPRETQEMVFDAPVNRRPNETLDRRRTGTLLAVEQTAWLQYYVPHELPDWFTKIVQSWDTANKTGELNNYSVCTTWGLYDHKFYLFSVYRQRLNYLDLRRQVVALAQPYRQLVIVIEDKASGTQLLQDLRGEIFGLKTYSPPAGTDKTMHLHLRSSVFENGHVFLPRAAPWLEEYVRELTTFPGVKHDDQVDSTTLALDYMRTELHSLSIWEKLGRSDNLR